MRVEVEFGLLGPFECRVDGEPVHLRSPNGRILLAALLVEPGRLVSVVDLIEAIWGTRQPDDPRAALHVCLTRLRAGLTAAGLPGLIVSEAGGYRVDVAAESVDVARFRCRLERATAAAGQADATGEGTELTEALRLWRGDPFSDVSSGYLQRRYGLQLVEQRLHAVERRIELRLAAGQHADVVDELTQLTAAYPLQERLWTQLMTALHAGGRRADALNAYHALRLRLAEELGIEPSDELQELYGTILGGDGGDGPHYPRHPMVPRQLPPEVPGFADRTVELQRVHALLERHERDEANSATVLVVTGMAGVGKTTLAAHWARRVADRFPDGQLWLDLRGYDRRGPATPQQAIATVLRALGVRAADLPADLDGQVGLYRSAMDGRRMLVVLDNANGAEQVLPLLPGDARTFVLITSRNDLATLVAREGATTIQLNPLGPTEARQLLEPRLGAGRLDAEPDAVSGIIDNCYGLPLALAIVAARAVGRPDFPLSAIQQQLIEAGSPLDRFADPAAGLDLRAVLSWSYHALSPPAARLFRLLGLHPTGDVSLAAAASLLDVAGPPVRLLLNELSAAHLVTEHVPGRYKLHDLVRVYASELAGLHDSPAQRQADLRRLVNWFTRTALNARPLLQPSESFVTPVEDPASVDPLTFADERAAREWYEAERNVLVASIEVASAHGLDDLCWRLAYGICIWLQLTGAWEDLLRTHATALQAATRIGDESGRAQVLVATGIAFRATGDTDRAIEKAQAGLAIFRATGNIVGTANALNNLCAAHRQAGDYDEALKCGRMAYSLAEALDEPGNMAISLYQVGTTLVTADRPDEALPSIKQALQLFCGIGHRRGEARTRQLAATVHTRLDDHSAAIQQYHAAVAIYQELGDQPYEAAMLDALGDALNDSGRRREGSDAWRRALAIYDQLGAAAAAELRAKLNRVKET
jgi:DNA-binding SARP family transcriptional activator/tetratricopeptide (TPR) repeat protein